MRVLHVVPTLDPAAGGPSRSVLLQAATARACGVDVRIAAKGATGADSVALEHLSMPGEFPTPAASRALAAAISEADVVEIHSVWNGTTSVASSLCRRSGVPYVLTPRGMLDPLCLEYRRPWKRIYGWMIEDRTIAGAGGFHFLSEEERDRAVIGRSVRAEHAIVAPNGASPLPAEVPQGVLHRLVPDRAGRRVLLHLGRLDTIKGIDLQLHALALVPEEERPMLVLVGPDFGDARRLRAIASAERLDPWVVWAGPVYGDDRYSLLADADLILLTSVYDCNPVIATETFAAGGALLGVAGCGGMDAAARAGAAIVVSRTPEELAAAIQKVLNDPARLTKLRQRARAYAADALTPTKVNEPLLRLYARLIQCAVPAGAA